MNKKPNAFYDEKPEECMYPLPGESDEDFENRMTLLREKRHKMMTPDEKKISEALANGTLSDEELKDLIVE